jgi:hypothetical protein
MYLWRSLGGFKPTSLLEKLKMKTLAELYLEAARVANGRIEMSEELRGQFEEWYEADAMPGESDWFKMKDDEYHHLNTQNAWEGFQACAKIKDAEIAELKAACDFDRKEYNGNR